MPMQLIFEDADGRSPGHLDSPRACIMTCFHCEEEIIANESGVVSIRNHTYHPTCVQCTKCGKRVDGSLLDDEGNTLCSGCMAKTSKSDRTKLVLKRAMSFNTMTYSNEPPVSLAELGEFERAFLEGHNQFRARHKVQHLVWSEMLTSKARRWAIHLVAQNKRNNYKTPLLGDSESESGLGLTCCTIPLVSGVPNSEMAEKVCAQWYQTEEHFMPGASSVHRSAPFTQMVWKETKRVGACLLFHCEVALVVAFYWPAGNIESEFAGNVSKVMVTPTLGRRKMVGIETPVTPRLFAKGERLAV